MIFPNQERPPILGWSRIWRKNAQTRTGKGSTAILLLRAKTPKLQDLENVKEARDVEDQGADPKLQTLQPQTGLPVSSIRSMGQENIKPLPGSQDSGTLPPTQTPLLRVIADG